MSPGYGLIAHCSHWLKGNVEGQQLLAIPRLHLTQDAALRIVGGVGLGTLFNNCSIDGQRAAYVGGSWMMWKTGAPELHGVGFVLGVETFDIGSAVKHITRLLT